MDQRPIIEICCGSADDVVAAFRAGAHRAELNCALPAGGLTLPRGVGGGQGAGGHLLWRRADGHQLL